MYALVTGANRGIGLEFCRQLVNKKYHVIATVRDLSKAEDLKKALGKSGEVIELDVNDKSSIRNLKKHLKNVPSLDLLINNAGVFKRKSDSDFDMLEEELMSSIQVNTIAPLLIFDTCLPWLEKSKSPVSANITSLMGSVGDNGSGKSYVYRMSKAALNAGVKSLSIDHPKVTSLLFHPGWVQTDMGGPNAQISAEKSVSGMLGVIEKSSTKNSGKFLRYDGSVLPW